MPKNHNNQNRESKRRAAAPDLNGAALVDDEGREIPITESMIRKSLAELERAGAPKRPEKA